jgi:hypothetical protein
MNQYLDFWETKLKPEAEKQYPGIKIFITRGTGGVNEFSYGLLYYIESVEVRDKYWPEDGKRSDVAEAGWEKIRPIWEELGKMHVSLSTEYTDRVIVR